MMKAIGYTQSLPISNVDSLMDIELPQPVATGRDFISQSCCDSCKPC